MPHTVYPSLRNKRVVVTGGGSSIGAAIVESFARQGAHVSFIDIAESESRELERRLSTSACAAPLPRVRSDRHRLRFAMVFQAIRKDIGSDRRSGEQRRERRPPQPGRDNARVLGRTHRGESASLFLLRAGGSGGYEGSARRRDHQSRLRLLASGVARSRDLSDRQGGHRRHDAGSGARSRAHTACG